jgi:peroxiredoxin
MLRLLAACAALSLPLLASGNAGRRAPGFSLPDVNLQQHDLYDYRGKVVVLEFMQTTCPNCQAFTGVLNRVAARYGDRVAVLHVVMPPDIVDTAQKYAADYKVKTPILLDCGSVALSYLRPPPHAPTIHVPHVFLIDREGIIRADWHHEPENTHIFTGDGLFPEIDKLLSARPAAVRPASAKPATPKAGKQ